MLFPCMAGEQTMFCKCFLPLLLSHIGLVASFCSITGQLFVRQLKAETMSRALALKLIKTIFMRVFSIIKGNGQIAIRQAKHYFRKDTKLQQKGTCSSNKFTKKNHFMGISARFSCMVHQVEDLKPF